MVFLIATALLIVLYCSSSRLFMRQRSVVVPETIEKNFSNFQQNFEECAVNQSSTFNPNVVIDKNIFFVWVGEASIPDRIIYAFAAAALVYGREWTLYVATTELSADDLLKKVEHLLASASSCPHATIKHMPVNIESMLRDELHWSPEHVHNALDVYAKKDRINTVTISDLVRSALIYLHGGVYLDTDMIALHKITTPTLGVDYAGELPHCGPTIEAVDRGRFPSRPFGCMCNCIFAFPKGHPFMGTYVRNMAGHIIVDKWGNIGPDMMFATLNHLLRHEPSFLDDITGMNMRCLACVRGGSLDYCTNYSYFSAGSTDGEVPPLALAAFSRAVASIKCL